MIPGLTFQGAARDVPRPGAAFLNMSTSFECESLKC